MKKWLRTHPMLALLLPEVALILGWFWGTKYGALQLPEVPSYSDTLATYQFVLTDYPSARAKTFRCEAGDVYLYLQPDSTRALPSMGDTVQVRTQLQTPGFFGDFDYGTYLRRQGIVATGMVWRDRWQTVGKGRPSGAKKWRHQLVERYRTLGFEGAELGTLSALTLGYKEYLDNDQKRSFRNSGAAHVLAVSGLHTGILYLILLQLLTGFGRWKPLYEDRLHRCINSVIVVALMWLYACLTGLTPSVVRSVVMLTLVEVAHMCYRQPISMNTLAAAAFVILAACPNDLFAVSFQLSFAAVAAILLLVPLLRDIVPIYRIRNRCVCGFVQFIWDLVVVSLAAQLGTLPISLYYFGQTANYFLLTNLMVIPLTSVIVWLAVAVLTVGWIPCIGMWLVYPLRWAVVGLNTAVGWVEHLPGAVTPIHATVPMVLALYAAMTAAVLVLKKSLWWLTAVAGALVVFCYLYLQTVTL